VPRPVASSLLTLALVAVTTGSALVSASWAGFTDDAGGGGRVAAGTVDVVLNDDSDDTAVLTYTGPECGNLAQGESCTSSLTVHNAGTLVVRYNIRVVDTNNDCYTSRLSSEAALEFNDRPPGDRVTGELTSTLDGDLDRCQDSTNSSVVIVTARQAKNPHPK
jgi:hypothetical protein